MVETVVKVETLYLKVTLTFQHCLISGIIKFSRAVAVRTEWVETKQGKTEKTRL